ncbi:hypothetical protein FOL47_009105 [Perkinsus chesapeaki]|uniref:EF-hand domain-containing protein n=1 Tax=Perkinsus chesapeaki TaxID=330153 RepID=A0A7J6LAH7_PERCH|nr:hypothetical protein FOL47_009105 [Perkinsus chesapeaki]
MRSHSTSTHTCSASSILDHFREKARLIPKPNSDPDRASYIARYIASRGKTTHWEDDSAARRATLRLRGALRSRNRPQTVPSEPHEAAPEGCSVLEAIPPRNDRKRSSVTRASFDDSVKSREGWASERSRSVERRGSRYNSLPGGVNPEFRRRYRKDACEALRILVLGSQNSEGDPPPVCSDHIGTRQDVARLHELWAPLDPNDKGQIPSLSFVERFDAHRSTRVLAIRVVTCLTESHPSSSINLRLNDVILLMWPRAGPEEFDTILQWLREFRSYEKRVATPPVWRELVENFRYIDSDKHGTIQLEELLEANILGPDEVQELIDRYDADGDGEINEFEFLTTLCPDGYRAHPTSRKGEGARETMQGYTVEGLKVVFAPKQFDDVEFTV